MRFEVGPSSQNSVTGLTVATLCYFATTVKPVNYDHLRDWEIVVSGGATFG